MVSSKVAALFAYIGGTLLLVAGATGSVGLLGTVIEYIIDALGGAAADVLLILLQTLHFVADLGGASVVIGGSFILNDRKRIGRFLIGLGAGVGLIGFLIILVSAFLHGWVSAANFLFLVTHSVGWVGVIFAIVATLMAR